MTAVLTIRDVPDEVRDVLARDARDRGQSLQAMLLALVKQHAAFSGNRQLIAEIERDLGELGGAAEDAPDAAEVIRAARVREGESE
jgi:hypothetical protein